MLTIVICSSGVSYNQQLLDLTLQKSIGRLNNKTKICLQFIRSTKFSLRKQNYTHNSYIRYYINICSYK